MVVSKKQTKLSEMINPKMDGNEDLREADPIEDDEGNLVIGRRIVKTEKQEFELQSVDPTGFWKVVTKKGTVPLELSGMYTSPVIARKAIESYVNSH